MSLKISRLFLAEMTSTIRYNTMRLPGKNILIIDDDQSHRLLLRKILENAGSLVDEASAVKLALTLIQSKLPDLVILDLNMPEHDGFIFLKFRIQNRLLHSIPVLVLSSSTNKPIIEKALALGANQFLEKPLIANLVLQKLRYLFYSQEHFSYTFPQDKTPLVTAEINGNIIGHSENQFKISSPTKFEKNKPVQILLESFSKLGGSTIVGKIENRRIEINEGLYEQILTLVGMSKEEKERFREWEQNLPQ